MIYKHIRTGVLYRLLYSSFSVERQKQSCVYISLENGAIFDRDAEKFRENFIYMGDAQTKILPKEPPVELRGLWFHEDDGSVRAPTTRDV